MSRQSSQLDQQSFEKLRANARVPMSVMYEKLNPGPDGMVGEREKLNPKKFSGIYSDSMLQKADNRTHDGEARIWGEKSTEGQQLELAVWYAQKVFAIVGSDVRIVPTSRVDDIQKGVDFVLEWKPETGSIGRIGIDVTTDDRDKKEEENNAKIARLKETFAHYHKNYKLDGALRRLAFFKSDFIAYPGYNTLDEETKERDRGLWVPSVIASIAKEDLYQFCIDLCEGGKQKTLKDPNAFLAEHPTHPFFEKIRISIIEGIDRELARISSLASENPKQAEAASAALDHIRESLVRPITPQVERPLPSSQPQPRHAITGAGDRPVPAIPTTAERARRAARALEEAKLDSEIEKIRVVLKKHETTERTKRSLARSAKKAEAIDLSSPPQIKTLLKKKLLQPKDSTDAVPPAVERYRAQKETQKRRIAEKIQTRNFSAEAESAAARNDLGKRLEDTRLFQALRQEPKHRSFMERIRSIFGWSKESEEAQFELQSNFDDGEAALAEFKTINEELFSRLEEICAPDDIRHARSMDSPVNAAMFLKKKLDLDREAGKITRGELDHFLDTFRDAGSFGKKQQFNETDRQFMLGLQSELYDMKNPPARPRQLFEDIMRWDAECDLLAEIAAQFSQ